MRYRISVLLSLRATPMSYLKGRVSEKKHWWVDYISRIDLFKSRTYLIFSSRLWQILTPTLRFSSTVVPYSWGTTQSAMFLASSYSLWRVADSPICGLCNTLKKRRWSMLDQRRANKSRGNNMGSALTQIGRCRARQGYVRDRTRPCLGRIDGHK